MEKEKIRIICFGSGDFPIPTFEMLVKQYNVVGFVTSNDKPVFSSKRVYDIATENNIPVYIPKNLEDESFLQWLDEINGNVYCVISYKFLPKKVVEKSHYAFNVHASLLPLLRGAAPINWAIRYGFKETGLSVISLSDKIDTGGIYSSYKMAIYDDDNFETLFKRLSDYCIPVTGLTMDSIIADTFYVNVVQNEIPKELDNKIFHAPRLNSENTTFSLYNGTDMPNTGQELYNMIRSLAPNIGTTMGLRITKWVDSPFDGGDFEDIKTLTIKIYDAELVNKGAEWINENYKASDIITDWKNYLYILPPSVDDYVVSVKKIQVKNKQTHEVKEFLKGFQVYNKPENSFFIN